MSPNGPRGGRIATTSQLEWAIGALARRQGGHVTHGQLRGFGLTDKAIRHRLERGSLIRVHKGVYAVGYLPTDGVDRAHGALLACGAHAVLSHSSAAALWRIRPTWRDRLEVTVPTNRRPRGVVVHRSTRLLPVDIVKYRGLRATSRARTLLDQAPRMADPQLLRAVNGQRIDYGLRLASLRDVLERFPRHPGARRLRTIAAAAPDRPYRSEWEIEWPPYADRHDLPEYEMNYVICGVRVDVFFVVERVIVELDGWETHGTRPAFEADRDRRNMIFARTGIPTYAMTYHQFHAEGDLQAARLHAILDRRRAELAA